MLLISSDFEKNAKVFLPVRFSETLLNIKDNLTFFFFFKNVCCLNITDLISLLNKEHFKPKD